MKKEKMHKIDLIFIVGIICIGIFGGLIDGFYWKDVTDGGFPVYSCMSVFGSYALWIILLIYSSITYKNPNEKPKYVKWYWYFILPFFHLIFAMVGSAISSLIINIFNL